MMLYRQIVLMLLMENLVRSLVLLNVKDEPKKAKKSTETVLVNSRAGRDNSVTSEDMWRASSASTDHWAVTVDGHDAETDPHG